MHSQTLDTIREQNHVNYFDGLISFSNWSMQQITLKSDQVVKVLNGLMKELHSDNVMDLLLKAKELKEASKR